jgi:G3E family GTPase
MSLLPRELFLAGEPARERLPVVVLTGFLGSGKTTLLNRLLSEPDLSGVAVIINEFGAVGLDHDLVTHAEEDMVLLANGCICCTVRGDLVDALEQLAASPQAREGRLRRILVETTGLADPAPILHTLMAEPRVTRFAWLAGVACTVDAVNGAGTLDRQPEAVKQAAMADALLITKTDLADAATRAPLSERLARINPVATVHDEPAAHRAVLRAMLESAPASTAPDADDATPAAPSTDASDPGLRYRVVPRTVVDPNRHDDRIRAFTVIREQPIAREGFLAWLEMIARLRGDDLLRVKGLVQLADAPDRPMVIHGVQHLFHPPQWLPAWPSDDHRTRIVFITRDIDVEALDEMLRVFERGRRRVAVGASP